MPLPSAPVAVSRRAVLVLAGVLLATGCNRLSFVRPDMSRGDYTQTAHVVEIREDARNPAIAAQQRLLLARHRFAEGALAEARTHAQAALDLDPRSADAHTLLALVADRQSDARGAGRHFATAAELAPTAASFNNYGSWLCGHGRPAEALGWFDRALADAGAPDRAATLANAGRCAALAGQPVRAERDLRAALALDPDSVVALGAMAELLLARGDAFAARAFSQRRLAAGPVDAPALQLASQIEQKLGDTAAAERYTSRLRAEFGDFPAQSGDQ